MKAQSEYLGFIIAIIVIILILIPLFLILSDYSVPSAKRLDYATIVGNQLNGGAIIIFFNSTPSKSFLMVYRGNANYTLSAVYYDHKGIWYNITSLVNATIKVNGVQKTVFLPAPLVYNFTLPSRVWNYTLVLQLEAYNVTVFATVFPNETAYTS